MSRFVSDKLNEISPYIPGEQPQDKKYIKLNTNENPYFTSKRAVGAITKEVLLGLKRYSDPECTPLKKTIANYYGVGQNNVLITNGSDEALAFCFQAYGRCGVCYADITYGFYDVFAHMYDCPAEHIPLEDDFTIDITKYFAKGKTVVIANPNAQTGIALDVGDIEKIVQHNADNIVIIDQAYVDFFGQNAIPLIKKHNNLVVVNTFSKSRSLAGARVGYIVADEHLIADLNKVKYSFHPYNVNTISMLLAKNAMEDEDYFTQCVSKIIAAREEMSEELKKLGFTVLPSSANFVLARTDKMGGKQLYEKLKENGILVRHFSDRRIDDFVRITVGTDKETKILIKTIKNILESK